MASPMFEVIDRIMTEVVQLLATGRRHEAYDFIQSKAVDESMASVLMALVNDLQPPDLGETTRGRANDDVQAGSWEDLKRNSCLFGDGGFLVARVFATGEPLEIHVPDESPAERVRVYYVERGVEMGLGVANFMDVDVTIEPFYVHPDETEDSEGLEVVPKLGKGQMVKKSELGEGETRDGWRLKDMQGAVILTVYLACGA